MVDAVHIIAHGRVQSVWFRAGTKERADELSLVGWARNCPDGTVEIHAEGERSQLETFIEWCRKGTPAAEVTSLDINWVSSQDLVSFEIRH